MSKTKKWIVVCLVLCMAVGFFGCAKVDKGDPNAIARVVTGDKTVYVNTVEDLIAAVDESGNTVITLQKDISYEQTITLPYSCTIDLGGRTITTNPDRGIGIMVQAAGTESPTTRIQNGTLKSYSDSIRVKGGALVVSDMDLHCAFGNCVALYDPNEAYKDINRIENSTLTSVSQSCFSFSGSDTDYSGTGITIENSMLAALNAEGSVIFQRGSGETAAGLVELGSGVTLYSYADIIAVKNMLFNGSGMAKAADAELTVDGNTYTGINKWSADETDTVLDVLMIGNSFCWYFTEELHGIASSAGIQLNISNLYKAGCSVEEHWTWLDGGSAAYEQYWITNDFGRFKHPDNLSIPAALAYDDWDVITLQQHFSPGRTKDYETALASCMPYVKNLYDHLKANCPDAKLYWQETWAYGVGYPTDKETKTIGTVAQQTNQYNQIRDVSRTLCEENGVDMIPSGDAWQIARANPKVGDTLCKADRCHDGDIGGGQYLNACVWFEVLTGRSCIGNTWRPDYRLSEEKIVELQKAAHEAVAAVYGEDYAK